MNHDILLDSLSQHPVPTLSMTSGAKAFGYWDMEWRLSFVNMTLNINQHLPLSIPGRPFFLRDILV